MPGCSATRVLGWYRWRSSWWQVEWRIRDHVQDEGDGQWRDPRHTRGKQESFCIQPAGALAFFHSYTVVGRCDFVIAAIICLQHLRARKCLKWYRSFLRGNFLIEVVTWQLRWGDGNAHLPLFAWKPSTSHSTALITALPKALIVANLVSFVAGIARLEASHGMYGASTPAAL